MSDINQHDIDMLLDELIEMRDQRDDAREEAQEWRNVAIMDPNMKPSDYNKALRLNRLPWENP